MVGVELWEMMVSFIRRLFYTQLAVVSKIKRVLVFIILKNITKCLDWVKNGINISEKAGINSKSRMEGESFDGDPWRLGDTYNTTELVSMVRNLLRFRY